MTRSVVFNFSLLFETTSNYNHFKKEARVKTLLAAFIKNPLPLTLMVIKLKHIIKKTKMKKIFAMAVMALGLFVYNAGPGSTAFGASGRDKQPMVNDDDFCTAISKILEASKTGFQSIKGGTSDKKDPFNLVYTSSIQIPGADQSSIKTSLYGSGPHFFYADFGKNKDKKSAVAKYNVCKKQLQACPDLTLVRDSITKINSEFHTLVFAWKQDDRSLKQKAMTVKLTIWRKMDKMFYTIIEVSDKND
jgi:hypothetical protein